MVVQSTVNRESDADSTTLAFIILPDKNNRLITHPSYDTHEVHRNKYKPKIKIYINEANIFDVYLMCASLRILLEHDFKQFGCR
jgi:hypothetical protein